MYVSWEYKFYSMTFRLFGTPSSRASCVFFVLRGGEIYHYKEGGSKKLKSVSHGGLGSQTLKHPTKLWKNHADMLSDALAFLKTIAATTARFMPPAALRGMSLQ